MIEKVYKCEYNIFTNVNEGNNMNKLIKLINLAQGERTLNQYALNAGISSAMLSLIKNGLRKPSPDILLKLSKNARNGVTYFDLMKATGYLQEESNVEPLHLNRNVIKVPIYGEIPAGVPVEMIEDDFIEEYEEVDADFARGSKVLFGLKIKGDSMYPEFRNGDNVIFQKVDTCENGDYCAVSINGTECTFKKVIRKENGITLMPLNSAFEPMFYTNQEIEELPITILGVVVEVRRTYKR